jgi:hypothetical protein
MYPEDTPILTREDAVRFMEGPDAREPSGMKPDEIIRRTVSVSLRKYFRRTELFWGFSARRGCTLTRKEQAMRLRAMGITVMHYEGSQPGDRTDLDEKRFLEQLDFWMESQGLRKLED